MLLPTYERSLEDYQLRAEPLVPRAPKREFNRVALAAAQVVSDPLAAEDPWQSTRPALDWEATMHLRQQLMDQGLGLAEAMDTAQRGMGLDWASARELIERSCAAARAHPLRPLVVCGANTDQREPEQLRDIDAIFAAYAEQMEAIEAAGGSAIIMASRALPRLQLLTPDYVELYQRLLQQAAQPVLLHWLGPMFDPQLQGYWGSDDFDAAAETVLEIIMAQPEKIDGIKVSLLEARHEIDLRARLPAGVKLYTGDDFNYVDLIAGDGQHYSHALLGVFAAIAPAASQALEALAADDEGEYRRLLEPSVALAREIFKRPTQHYKAGIAFLAWLNGAQPRFVMPMGLHAARSLPHYAQIFRLADQARLLLQPELAVERMGSFLRLHGL